GTDLANIDLDHPLDWPRQLEVGTGGHDAVGLAKAQHHAILALIHQLHAVEQQPDQHQTDDDQGKAAVAAAFSVTAATTVATAKHAAQVVLETIQEGLDVIAGAAARWWVFPAAR